MAVTLLFTLHPLQSLLASKRAAKKATLPGGANETPTADETSPSTLVSRAPALPSRERLSVRSSSRASEARTTRLPSEQAQLAARGRIDV
jgi:hypothetical protein